MTITNLTPAAAEELTNCTSWICRKYRNGEINTYYSYVAVNDPSLQDEWYFQGEEAENVIKEVHEIWKTGKLDQQQAFDSWINSNLY